MKKNSMFLMLLCCAAAMVQAETPSWMDESNRAKQYPQSKFFTGYVFTEPRAGELPEETIDRAKQEARAELTASIHVTVEKSTTNSLAEVNNNGDLSSSEAYVSRAKVSTGKIDIPGVTVEYYVDDKKSTVHAFAYVGASSLSSKLQRQLTTQLTRVDILEKDIEQYLIDLKRDKAAEALKEAKKQLGDAETTRVTLVAVASDLDDEALMTKEWREASKKLKELEQQVSTGPRVYIACKADCMGRNVPTLGKEIQGKLSAMQCIFVYSEDEADWVIYIEANSRDREEPASEGKSMFFSYVDTSLRIVKRATNQTMYDDAMSVKGGDTRSYYEAARMAYKDIPKKVVEICKQYIQ